MVGVLLATVATVATSASGSWASSAPGRAPAAGAPDFSRPVHQLTVTVTADNKGAATGFISNTTGGTLVATGSNGTRYRLHFPPGALLSSETVTMTPVSAVHGSPIGSLVGAVSITPDEMELTKPAVLTVFTPKEVSPGRDAAFMAGFGGKYFSLYPMSSGRRSGTFSPDNGGGTSLSLEALSTYGISAATNAQVKTALAYPPFSTEAQFQQLLVAAIRSGASDTIDMLLSGYFTQVVSPLVSEGLRDYTQVEAAVVALLHWAQTVETLGASTDSRTAAYYGQVRSLLAKLLLYEAQRLYEDCTTNHNLRDLRQLLLGQRQAVVLGVDLGSLADAAQRCGHFEFEVTSDLSDTEAGSGFFTDVSLKLQLSMDSDGVVSGEGTPVFTRWEVKVKPSCETFKTVGVDLRPAKVYDIGLVNDLDLVRYAKAHNLVGDVQSQPDLEVTFQPGNSRELYVETYCGGTKTPAVSPEGGLWWYAWRYLHVHEMISDPTKVPEPKFLLEHWLTSVPGPDALVAQKSYQEDNGVDISEHTQVKLYLRPQ